MTRRVDYGSGLKSELFGLVHDICDAEIGVSMQRHRTTNWFARPDIFAGYLNLHHIKLKYLVTRPENLVVSEFDLWVDDGDTQLKVVRQAEGDLTGDPLADYMLKKVQDIYLSHDHDACVDAVSSAVQGTPLARARSLDGEVLLK